MNSPDHDPNVCDKDSYGNVTAHNQNGNDNRDETKYKDFTIDNGISFVVWMPDDSFFGKFPNADAAKAAVDVYYLSK